MRFIKFLKLKAILVSLLVIVMIVSIPIVSMPGNKHIKHALEWDFFLGVILFYVLTFFSYKKVQDEVTRIMRNEDECKARFSLPHPSPAPVPVVHIFSFFKSTEF